MDVCHSANGGRISYIENAGTLISVAVDASAEETKVALQFLVYHRDKNQFLCKHSMSKELTGFWKLLDVRKVFCTDRATNKVCIFLMKSEPLGSRPSKQRSSNNACFYVVKDMKRVNSHKFVCRCGSVLPGEDIKAWIVSGPAVLICNTTEQVFHYTKFSTCDLKNCNASTCISESSTLVQPNTSWSYITLLSSCRENTCQVYNLIICKLLRNSSVDVPRHSLVLVRISLNEELFLNCFAEVPKGIKLNETAANLFPTHYNDCISSVHLLRKNDKKCCSVICMTSIGQLLHCIGGEVTRVCDIPLTGPVKMHELECNIKLLVVCAVSNGTICIIDMPKFQIIKCIYNISHIITGCFTSYGCKSQLLCLKDSQQIRDEIIDFELFVQLSDFVKSDNASCTIDKVNDNKCPEEELLPVPMGVNREEPVNDCKTKVKVECGLQHTVTQQRDLLMEQKETLVYKTTGINDTQNMLHEASNNLSFSKSDCDKSSNCLPIVKLFCQELDICKEDDLSPPPPKNTKIKILGSFQKCLEGQVHACVKLKNLCQTSFSEIVLHISKSRNCDCRFQPCEIKYCVMCPPVHSEDLFFPQRHPDLDKHWHASKNIDPGCEAWIMAYFPKKAKLIHKNCRGKCSFFMWMSYMDEHLLDRVLVHVCEYQFHYEEEFSLEITSCQVDMENIPDNRTNEMVLLNALQTSCFKHSVCSNHHGVAVINHVLQKLNFVKICNANTWICTEMGLLRLVRVRVCVFSQTSCYLYVMCRNDDQNKCFGNLLRKVLPADLMHSSMNDN